MEHKTTITEQVATRRMHQGLFYLLGATDRGQKGPEPESLLAVSTVMAYLAAYAFPDCNLGEVKQRMLVVLEPLKSTVDVEAVIDKAFQLAGVFRRPWTEPGNREDRTI
jgi:hypothetical protein